MDSFKCKCGGPITFVENRLESHVTLTPKGGVSGYCDWEYFSKCDACGAKGEVFPLLSAAVADFVKKAGVA